MTKFRASENGSLESFPPCCPSHSCPSHRYSTTDTLFYTSLKVLALNQISSFLLLLSDMYIGFRPIRNYISCVRRELIFKICIMLQDFFIEFSRSRPCVLSRSILQVLYFGNCRNGICGSPNSFVLTSLLFVEVLRDACKNFIAPPSLTTFNKQMIFSSTHVSHVLIQFWHKHNKRLSIGKRKKFVSEWS